MKSLAWSAFLVAGALAFGSTAPDAYAKERRLQRYELVTPVRSPDGDARGTVKVKRKRRGTRTTVKLRHLTPGADYVVHDADTNEVLGTVTANKRGRARLKVKRNAPRNQPAGKAASTAAGGPGAVVVYREGDDKMVLVGDDENRTWKEALEDASFGDAYYGTLRGANAGVSLFSDGDGHDEMSVVLEARTADGRSLHEFHANTMDDAGLPGGADGVAELSEKPFAIVDADDTEVVSGTLPALHSFADLENEEWMFTPPETGTEDDDVTFRAPFALRIALDGETLETVAELRPLEGPIFEVPEDLQFAFLGFGQGEGTHGTISMFADEVGECFVTSLVAVDGDARSVHEYAASTFDGQGELPLGVESLADLQGRTLQIRNAAGESIVERTIPELQSSGDGIWDEIFDGAEITPGEGPFTVWIAGGDGVLQKAGEMVSWDDGGWFPGPIDPEENRFGSAVYGDFEGASAIVFLSSIGDEYSDFSISVFVPDGEKEWSGTSYDYCVAREDDENELPFGVEDASELAGRAFELRNGDGETVLADDLPEMETLGRDKIPFNDFGTDEGTTFEPGAGPFTIWIADAEGTLTRIAKLRATDIGGPVVITDGGNVFGR